MEGREFWDRVHEHADLDYLGVWGGQAVIRCPSRRVSTALEPRAILGHRWEDLEAALTGRRPLRILKHVTRIVGYFSVVQNWNRSKLAELRDRRRGAKDGRYALDETERRGCAMWPSTTTTKKR